MDSPGQKEGKVPPQLETTSQKFCGSTVREVWFSAVLCGQRRRGSLSGGKKTGASTRGKLLCHSQLPLRELSRAELAWLPRD